MLDELPAAQQQQPGSQSTTVRGQMLIGPLEYRLSKQLQSLLNRVLMFPGPGGFPFCFCNRSARYTQEMGLSKNSNTHGKGGRGRETQLSPEESCSHIQTSAENCSLPTFNSPTTALKPLQGGWKTAEAAFSPIQGFLKILNKEPSQLSRPRVLCLPAPKNNSIIKEQVRSKFALPKMVTIYSNRVSE